MRIQLDNTIIAAGGHEAPAGLTIVETRALQGVDYVRAAYGAQFPRGNWRHEISFTVTRLHADLRAATLFIVDHPQTVPASGLLAILHDDRGSAVGGRWIRDAVTNRVECVRLIGMTTIWAYAFVGGEVLKKNPKYAPSAGRTT